MPHYSMSGELFLLMFDKKYHALTIMRLITYEGPEKSTKIRRGKKYGK